MPPYPLFLVSLGLAFLIYWYFRYRTARHPPGPVAYPLIGNIITFPMKYPWKHFSKEHGDLIYYHGFGCSILVLNSLESITDLLVRRGNIYSGRPFFTVACDLMDLMKSTALLPFGSRWKLHRTLSRLAFNPAKVKQYESNLSSITQMLMVSFHKDPDAFADHVRLAAGRVLLSTIYGINDHPDEEKYISTGKAAMVVITKALMPLAFLVDLIPALKFLPKWLPFMSFQHAAHRGRVLVSDCVEKPFDHVKSDIKNGIAKPSFTLDVLTEDDFAQIRNRTENFESELKWASGTMFVAGQELIAVNILKMIAAMTIHPDMLSKSQEELNHVAGSRSPTIKDRDDCPYVNAIIKETMRFQNSAPLSVVRASSQDDVYKGYFIPKNTIIVPNVWGIAYAPDDEYSPDTFAPQRFLRDNPPVDPSTYHFGFGRRMCPGRALAEDALFLMAANILKTFDITHKVDANGQQIPINIEYGSGLILLPSEFQCDFRLRVEI